MRTSVGLLCEHLLCRGEAVYAHALPEADAAPLFFDLETNGVDYVAVPWSAVGCAVVTVFASAPFEVDRPVAELRNTTRARGQQAGVLDAGQAAAKILFSAHSHLAGPARMSDRWARIALGVEVGSVHGTCGG